MTRDQIMQRLASAQSWDEQMQLVAELDALDVEARKTAQAERSLDWAETTVRQTLAPGRTLDRHTASSDWLAEADTDPGENHHHAVIAEASVWFSRLDPDVKADAGEFVEQAKGIARRTAGKYGAQADAAADAFLQYVAFLNRQVLAASGLPQVQQRVDSFENDAPTPLPTDVFDNFAPPIHPINQGVDGTQTNSLAPGAEEAMAENNGGPVGRPSEHDETGEPVSEPQFMPPSARQGSHKHAGALERAKDMTARKGHNMRWTAMSGPDDPWMGRCQGCGASVGVTTAGIAHGSTAHDLACTNRSHGMLDAPSVAIGYHMNMDDFLRAEAAKQGSAGGRPFVRKAEREGGDDDGSMPGGDIPISNPHDPDNDGDDDSTPRGDTDHDYFDQGGNPRPNRRPAHGARKNAASGLDQVQQTVDSFENPKPTSLPMDTMFPIVQPWAEEEASYDKGGESQSGGGTGRPSAHNERAASRRTADMYGGGDSPHQVPGGETPVANSPATTPPRAGDGDFNKGVAQGQADAAAGDRPSFADNSSAVSDFVRGYVQGYGTGQPSANPQDVPGSMGGDNGQGRNFAEIQQRQQPMLNMASKGLTVSAALVTKDVSSDADFQRGYRYARAWKPGEQVVALGSTGEEAGIYAGITDNPRAQGAWRKVHARLGKEHPELNKRMREHQKLGRLLHEAGHQVSRGMYVQAATSLDLDTMSPVTTPDPQGATPSEGPGTVPPLRGAPGTPAAPGGPAPYNGAEPLGQPVVPDPLMAEPEPGGIPMLRPHSPDAVNMTGDSSLLSKSPQTMAFRKRVQAAKLALRQKKEN